MSPARAKRRRRGGDRRRLLDACAEAGNAGLLAALDGRFVPPGPAGAPARGRLDVLPTGRNLFAIDPRAVPTRTAWEIGRRTAEEVVARYAQDHGEWPRRIVLDLWGSASMRTGGDEIAQAFALLGVRPLWDHASNRVNGFEILPAGDARARHGRRHVARLRPFSRRLPDPDRPAPRAIQDVAALDESLADNPLAAHAGAEPAHLRRGARPLWRRVWRAARGGDWPDRRELADAYLAATSHAYDGAGEGQADARRSAPGRRRRRLRPCAGSGRAGRARLRRLRRTRGRLRRRRADARRSARDSITSTRRGPNASPCVRLRQEIARVLRGRAVNPRWIAGQMRHGHRGAAEIAETLDNLFAYAALTDAARAAISICCSMPRSATSPCATSSSPPIRKRRGHGGVFDEARRRGLWVARRNSSAAILEQMRRPPHERAPAREGWCPGALRPMRTGDGLLVRLRVSGKPLSLDRPRRSRDARRGSATA